MKPSNLHERRQLFSTASQWYLPFTLCHLKDRPRGEWRFVPAAAVCPAGLIKCSTWWVGAICLFARLHIRVLSWFLFLVIILVVLPILHFQPRCQVAYAEHRAHVCGGKVSGSTRQWKIKATSKEHLWQSLFFFPTPGVWLGCVSCASSKQLISVDLHWFALRLHQPPSPTFNAVWRTGLVSTNRSSLKGAKPKFWQDGCDDRVASVHLLPSGHISANFPIVHFPNLSFQQKQRLWGSHGEFTVRTRVLGVCFFCCALSAMIDMTPCQVASCYHC